MKKLTIFALVAITIQSCSRTTDNVFSGENVTTNSEKKISDSSDNKVPLAAPVPLQGFYSSVYNKHGYSTSGNFFIPSYFHERILGAVTSNNAFPQYTTYIFYNTQTGDSLITENPSEIQTLKNQSGWIVKEMLGSADSFKPLIPVYRYYRHQTKSHFFTTNYNEIGAGAMGFQYEGIGFYVNPY